MDLNVNNTNFIVPLQYKKFYSSLIAKYKDYKLGDFSGFNLSCGTRYFKIKKNDNDIYNLFNVRFHMSKIRFETKDDEFGELKTMIPGNMYCETNDTNTNTNNNINGYDFFWNNWSEIVNLSYYFIGKVDDKGNIDEIQKIYIDGQDNRIIYLKTINSDNKKVWVYLLCPRIYHNDKFKIIMITKYFTGGFVYKIINLDILNENKHECVRKSDSNMPYYESEYIKYNKDFDIIKIHFLRFFENNCITGVNLKFIIPNNKTIEKYLFFTEEYPNLIKLIDDIYGSNQKIKYNALEHIMKEIEKAKDKLPLQYFYELLNCELFECRDDEKEFKINNNYINGIYKKNGLINSPLFSFGSPFINMNDGYFLSVGHIKIPVADNDEIKCDPECKMVTIRDKIKKILSELFNDEYKMHLSHYCKIGYHYLSYFMIWDRNTNEFYISDFFMPIDFNDRYHFSLIFTSGIYDIPILSEDYEYIGSNIIITSGEGDYYSSVMKFRYDDIFKACTHNIMSNTFDIEKMEYFFIVKTDDGNIKTVNINEFDVNSYKNIKNYVNKYLNNKQQYSHLLTNNK